jgi:hypothetical protein
MKMKSKGRALTPSKHLRSTLGIVLGAAMALSACGAQQVEAAAIVDGTAIKDKDVQTASLEVNKLAQGQQQIPSSRILLSLIVAPYVLAEASKAGKTITDAEVRKVIAKVDKPSPPTMEIVRMQLALQSLSEASKVSIVTKLLKAKITVNPRYGTFNAKQIALAPSAPNWFKASATPAAK